MIRPFIDLYTLIGSPKVETGSHINAKVECSEKVRSLITQLSAEKIIIINEILLDNDEIDISDVSNGQEIEIDLSIPTNGTVNIYIDIEDLINRNSSLSKNGPTAEFYVIKDNYYSPENTPPNRTYENLRKLLIIIQNLNDLAHYHDERSKNRNLVFVSKSDDRPSNPVAIQPHISLDLLNKITIDSNQIESCINHKEDGHHANREKGIFRASIIEFFEGSRLSESEKFSFLINNWSSFDKLYSQNFETYLSGYAFQKVKHEIAGIELNLAEQFSKLTNDMTSKILSTPISFAAVIVLMKTESLWERIFIFIGIITASWIIHLIISNQYQQFQRMKNARAILLSSHESLKDSYPKDLKTSLESAILALQSSEKTLQKTFNVFRVLCWSPSITSAIVIFLSTISIELHTNKPNHIYQTTPAIAEAAQQNSANITMTVKRLNEDLFYAS